MLTAKDVVCYGRLGLVALGFVLVVGAAQADLLGVHLTIEGVDDSARSASVEFTAVQDPDGNWIVDDASEHMLMAGEIEIGRVTPDIAAIFAGNENLNPADMALHNTSSGVTYIEDPTVNLNFAVQAGASTTTFYITSALLNFPTIGGAVATASASYSVTDVMGDGATLSGITTAGGAYEAGYNGFVGMGGTTFDTYFSTITTTPFGSANPVMNTAATAIGSAFDMSSTNEFTLSAFDIASGTTTFSIIPEPATFGLLALGLVLIRRR